MSSQEFTHTEVLFRQALGAFEPLRATRCTPSRSQPFTHLPPVALLFVSSDAEAPLRLALELPFDDGEGADALRQAARDRAATFAPPRKALLEPIIPAPLGMGVRASETVAHGLSPCTLRQSLEAHLSLRPPVSRAGPSYTAAYTNTTVGGASAAPLQLDEEEFEVQGGLYEGEEEEEERSRELRV